MIEVLVGMIASGKSTYAKHRADAGAIVISHDDLTEGFHACYRYEQELRAQYRESEEAIARIFLAAGRDIVVDRTHLTKESRGRWIDFARNFGMVRGIVISVVAVVFPVVAPNLHAVRRHRADTRGRSYADWLKVATHHYEQYQAEPISNDEGFDEFRFIGELNVEQRDEPEQAVGGQSEDVSEGDRAEEG